MRSDNHVNTRNEDNNNKRTKGTDMATKRESNKSPIAKSRLKKDHLIDSYAVQVSNTHPRFYVEAARETRNDGGPFTFAREGSHSVAFEVGLPYPTHACRDAWRRPYPPFPSGSYPWETNMKPTISGGHHASKRCCPNGPCFIRH